MEGRRHEDRRRDLLDDRRSVDAVAVAQPIAVVHGRCGERFAVGLPDVARSLQRMRCVAQTLLAAEPADPDRIHTHAQSEFWLGYSDFLQQRYDRARPHFQEYLQLAQELVRIDPDNAAYLRELGYAEGNLCSLYLARPTDVAKTLGSCRAALETMKRVFEISGTDPQVQLDLANRHAWLAEAHSTAGNLRQAYLQRQQQAAIMDSLVAQDPRNASYRQDWILSRYAMAMTLRDLGDTQAAMNNAREARDAIARLTAADPGNQDWQSWRARIEQTFPQASLEN